MEKIVLGITISGSVPLIRGQARYFKEQGYEVYLLCPQDEKSITYCKEEGCQLLPINIERRISPFKDLKTIAQIVGHLKKIKPDVVNVGTPKMGLLGTIASKIAGVPQRVYTCRGLRYEHESGLNKKLMQRTEKIAGSFAHKIICISPSVRDKAVNDGIFRRNKTRVIAKGSSNGIDLEKFTRTNINEKKAAELRKSLGIENELVFGFVGRLVDRKGINELYQAFNQVFQEQKDTKLVLVGKKDETQLQDKNLVNHIATHPGIRWVGWQDDIPLFMSIMDVFVMPAWWEGFGNSYIEAATMGIPVIGSKGTGCIDAVSHGFNGYQVPIKEIEPLKKAMKAYLQNEQLRMEHGQNGLKWAQNFKQEIIWNGLKNIYENEY